MVVKATELLPGQPFFVGRWRIVFDGTHVEVEAIDGAEPWFTRLDGAVFLTTNLDKTDRLNET